jgi:hypothetical protein
MLPDELPTSLSGWARLISARLDRPAQS